VMAACPGRRQPRTRPPRTAAGPAGRAATAAACLGRTRTPPRTRGATGPARGRTRRAPGAAARTGPETGPALGGGGHPGACQGTCSGHAGILMVAASKTPRAPARRSSRMPRADVVEMFTRLRELNPHPKTELEYSTPFELLVAVALSAQATDVGVNKATRRLFPVANTPQAILDLGEEGLKSYISTIGLYNAKAKNVIAACRLLVERHGGDVPRDRDALEALP